MVSICFNKFFRLPICLGRDSLIVNTGRNSVSAIQFHSHKLLQSWVLKQPESFSCPVVFDSHKNKLLSVIDKNSLLTWDYEADNLGEAEKTKFQDNIFTIVLVADEAIVVFDTGSCLWLEDAIEKHESMTQSCFKNDEKLLWVDATVCEKKILVFLLTGMHDNQHKLHFLVTSSKSGQIKKSSEQVISRDNVSLLNWCLKHGDIHPSFLTIWSDGQIHSYSEDCKSAHLLTVPGVEETEQLAIEVLDTCHIVVVRSHASNGCSYEIWDTKYSTKKTSKIVDSSVSENLQAKIIGDTLFLPSNQKIVAEPLKVEFSSLAAVVGKSLCNTKAPEKVLYSWTSDGMLHEESPDEESCSGTLSSTFSAVTNNELFEELLTKLRQGDAKVISYYLKEIKLISESKLVKLLQHLLRKHHPEFDEMTRAKGVSTKNVPKRVAHIFLDFFLIPYDDIFLQQHLRKLSFKEAVATLEILQFFLKENASCNVSADQHHLWDIERQVTKWLGLLTLSHFEELLLASKKEFMGNTANVLRNQIETLKKEVGKFQIKEPTFEHSTSTDYCIEILQL